MAGEGAGERFAEGEAVAVVTTEPLGPFLDYLAPEGGCAAGDLVEVPLGPRHVLGVVWKPGEGTVAPARMRSIARVLALPPLRDELRAFLARAADYTLTPLPAMLRLATRAPGLTAREEVRRVYRLAGPQAGPEAGPGAGAAAGAAEAGHRPGPMTQERMTPARKRVIEALSAHGGAPMTAAALAEAAACSRAVIAGMVRPGILQEEVAPRDRPLPRLVPPLHSRLVGDQVGAGARLVRAVAEGGFHPFLLKGVTGSGKTEVYLEAVAEALRLGRQALVLLPEIALTADFLARVEARFGARPGEWHSGVPPAGRRRLWKMAAEGGAGLVVGARSALFLPFRDLGLIVVDEEHDPSYKQEEGALYNARDMAVLRASIAGCAVVLASATPSLESWANAEAGRYARLDLGARYGTAGLPLMRAIDMRAEKPAPGRWISPTLRAGIAGRLAAGGQVLLFLNRRGFAPITLCRACGAQVGCDHCDARMVEHRFLGRLVCHQCGATKPVPLACPSCGVEGRMAAVGPGVERLAGEVAELFPEARLAVLSSDLFASARALREQIDAIAAGGADIVIGTQIVAKGHNFPHLTLVGVIDADLGLQGSDLRAAERTFQLMRQVSGRAGRAERPGEAWLQSYQPGHPVMRAILGGDEEGFLRAEAAMRSAAGMPPYGRLAGIILSGPDAAQAMAFGEELARNAAPLAAIGAEVFGPAPAPIARLRGQHRVRLLVRAARGAPLQAAITGWLGQARRPARLKLAVDIDPQSFL